MQASEFYNKVTKYIEERKKVGTPVGKMLVHPYSYDYGFSAVKFKDGKIVLVEGDSFDEKDNCSAPSLPLDTILKKINSLTNTYGDCELVYTHGSILESPTTFICSYNNIIPVKL